MQSSKILFIVVLFLGILFTGFECASTELTSARLYISQKNYPKAEEVLKKEVEKNPKSDEGWFLLAGLNGEKGDFNAALEDYNKSLAISNKYQKDITNQRYSYWVNQFKAGDTYYKRAIAQKDDDSVKVNLNKAVLSLTNAITILPDSGGISNPYKYLAFCYFALKQTDNAIKPLEQLAAIGKVPDGFIFLGKIYYDKGSDSKLEYQTSKNAQDSINAQEFFSKSISILEQGREKFPNESELLKTLSASYVGANKLGTAIGVFKSLAESDPKKENFYNYGVVLMGADKYEESITQFNKAIELDPNFKNALYNLAVSYVKWGAGIKKEIDEKGDKSEAYKDKFRLAIPPLEKLTQMEPKELIYWDLLGKVYANTDNEAKAKDAFDREDKLRKGN
jgi:tetratricopeptide (TPR) repeat protein